jgi:hypothetical protein
MWGYSLPYVARSASVWPKYIEFRPLIGSQNQKTEGFKRQKNEAQQGSHGKEKHNLANTILSWKKQLPQELFHLETSTSYELLENKLKGINFWRLGDFYLLLSPVIRGPHRNQAGPRRELP